MRKHPTIGIVTFGTVMCFMLVAADIVSAAFRTANGEVMIEAENYSRLAGSTGGKWFKSTAKPGYSGSGFMSAPSNDPTTLRYSSNTARVEYDIDFKETGTYYLHLRTYATAHNDNGFFATMDGRSFYYGHPNAYYIAVPWVNAWYWYSDGGGAEGRGYKVSINITNTGVHKLAIVRRDKGSRVDRIWLSKKVSTSPKTGSVDISSSQSSTGSSSTSTVSSSTSTGSSSTPTGSSSTSTTTTGSGITFVQGTDGLVKMDAFDYSAKASRSNHNWAEVRHLGVDAMEAIPDSGARIASSYVSNSPFLRFNVRFNKTGTHYVWLRAACQGSDNTAHVGLNGQASASSANVKIPLSKGWAWSNTVSGGGRATINVTKTGVQTVDVYMREDGLILEQIALATSSSYTPSGGGSTSTGGSSATVTGSGFLQKTDATGLVVMNARNHDAKASRSNHNWTTVNHLGVNAMEAIPDSGARIASGYVSNSPYLRFNVNFQKTGTHYVWLRGSCQGNDNTAHFGVNGNASASSANIKLPVNKGWVWSGTTMGGARTKVSVNKTGLQTVEVYMREDGLILDKVLITSSAAYTPAGSGPAQSVRK